MKTAVLASMMARCVELGFFICVLGLGTKTTFLPNRLVNSSRPSKPMNLTTRSTTSNSLLIVPTSLPHAKTRPPRYVDSFVLLREDSLMIDDL